MQNANCAESDDLCMREGRLEGRPKERNGILLGNYVVLSSFGALGRSGSI